MEKEQQELYEYARNRIKQKKVLYFHFVLLIIGSIFMFIANHYFLIFGFTSNWSAWVITAWLFLFILLFIKVFFPVLFLKKNWKREQITRFFEKQQEKKKKLQTKVEEDSAAKPQ